MVKIPRTPIEKAAAILGEFFRSTMSLLLPYLVPFLFACAAGLALHIFMGWSSVPRFMLRQAIGLWFAANIGGALTIVVALIAGLYAYTAAGRVLGVPAGQ